MTARLKRVGVTIGRAELDEAEAQAAAAASANANGPAKPA
jgi:hypothetical protein